MTAQHEDPENEKKALSALERILTAGDRIRKLPEPLQRELAKAREAYEEHQRESAAARETDSGTHFD